MAKKSIKTGVTQLDPMFYIPEGVEELAYVEEGGVGQYLDEDSQDYGDFDIPEDEDVDPNAELGTPEILEIISQTVRNGLRGAPNVIDVVFDVSDVEGADKYEFRIVKMLS